MRVRYVSSVVEALAVVCGIAVGLGPDFSRLDKRQRRIIAGILVVALAVVVRPSISELVGRLSNPPLFDYTAFWISARAAAAHLNFYDPRVSAAMAAPLAVTPDFVREIVDVGFWYPPPSMFLFYPLGLLAYRPALVLLDVATFVVVIADSFLLARIFFQKRGWTGYILSALLMFSLHGAVETFEYGQWTFVAMLFTLLFVRADRGWSAGVWAVLAAFTKPWLAILIGASLLRRDRSAVIAAIVAVVALFAASALAFGPATIAAFLRPQHYAALPPVVYFEVTNQSLHAFLLRHFAPAVVAPAFVVSAAVITVVSAVLIAAVDRNNRQLGYGLAICCGLLVYPVTQTVYDLLLVVPLCLLWQHALSQRARWGVVALFAGVALASRLPLQTSHPFVGDAIFGTFVVLWIVLALVCSRSATRRSSEHNGSRTARLRDAIA